MEIIIQPDSTSASALAAGIVGRLIREKRDCVLGLATGDTPVKLYRELIENAPGRRSRFQPRDHVQPRRVRGADSNHPASYHRFMEEHFFSHVNVPEHRIHIPDAMTPEVPDFCQQYEGAIKAAGGIDIQILGIGADGHIGFNEPTSSLGLAHPDQDAERKNPQRQCSPLRRGRKGPPSRHHHGCGDHHGEPYVSSPRLR